MQLRYFITALVLCVLMFTSIGTTSDGQNHPYSAEDPGSYLVEKAQQNRLILFGTHHKDNGIHNLIINMLPDLVNKAGVDTLFVEIPFSQQPVIDRFLKGEVQVDEIQISEIIASTSFCDILLKARDLKMNIVAIDKKEPSPLSRDEWMALHVGNYLNEHPDSKGLIKVGERHVLKDIQWAHTNEPSLADHLIMFTPFSVMTWPKGTDNALPIAMDVNPVYFKDIQDPTLKALNTKPQVSIATSADGIILMPKHN